MVTKRIQYPKDGERNINNSQRLFLVYIICILVDMTILNIFAEFSHSVYVESFSITIFIAIFLQLFIVLTKFSIWEGFTVFIDIIPKSLNK